MTDEKQTKIKLTKENVLSLSFESFMKTKCSRIDDSCYKAVGLNYHFETNSQNNDLGIGNFVDYTNKEYKNIETVVDFKEKRWALDGEVFKGIMYYEFHYFASGTGLIPACRECEHAKSPEGCADDIDYMNKEE